MDTTQILLTLVVTVLTILLSIIGVQVVFILIEIRKSMEKVNKMLSDATIVTSGIGRSVTGMSGLMEGLKTGLSFVNFFGKKRSSQSQE